jgi:hypothetical protein
VAVVIYFDIPQMNSEIALAIAYGGGNLPVNGEGENGAKFAFAGEY